MAKSRARNQKVSRRRVQTRRNSQSKSRGKNQSKNRNARRTKRARRRSIRGGSGSNHGIVAVSDEALTLFENARREGTTYKELIRNIHKEGCKQELKRDCTDAELAEYVKELEAFMET